METRLESKWIAGFEGLYSVRKDGAVRSHDRLTSDGRLLRGRWLKQCPDGHGYACLGLTKEGTTRTYKVHVLVADAFIPNPDGLPYVNHKDENKMNPHKDNLERCTHQYNCEYSNAKCYKLMSPLGVTTEVFNLKKFCRENNLNSGHMSSVVAGRRKQHKGWTRC